MAKDKDDTKEAETAENEYPKALNEMVDGKLVPVMWPKGHPKGGTEVVFENAEEEKAYRKVSK
jgi:hypothetical protein